MTKTIMIEMAYLETIMHLIFQVNCARVQIKTFFNLSTFPVSINETQEVT